MRTKRTQISKQTNTCAHKIVLIARRINDFSIGIVFVSQLCVFTSTLTHTHTAAAFVSNGGRRSADWQRQRRRQRERLVQTITLNRSIGLQYEFRQAAVNKGCSLTSKSLAVAVYLYLFHAYTQFLVCYFSVWAELFVSISSKKVFLRLVLRLIRFVSILFEQKKSVDFVLFLELNFISTSDK